MDRREFVKTGVATSLAASVAPLQAAPAPQKRPNILYVFSDQHRAASLPGEPFAQVTAPNIDAFRRANFSMDTCVSNYPLCAPYRGIFMTGRWPQQSTILGNGDAMHTSEFALTRAFKAGGYRTGYVGKWHLGGRASAEDSVFVPAGPARFDIDDWHVWGRTNDHYHHITFDPATGKQLNLEGWAPVPMTDQAIAFLQARAAEKQDTPWMLVLSYNPPHPPFNPPPDDQKPYAGGLKRRPNVEVSANSHVPWLRSDDKLHTAMEGYLGGITGVDQQFGRLLKALDDLKLADDTIVVYTSDHGEMLGSQGRQSKQVPYEESCRVPFAVRYPGVTPRGGSSQIIFAAVDIYPTLCGLAGIPVPKHCVGRDLSAAIRGQKVDAPKFTYLMNGAGGKGGPAPAPDGDDGEGKGNNMLHPNYRGIRTERYTYAVFENARWLLHDNLADPYQMKNLVNDPAQKALMESFDAQLRAWCKSTGDPFVYPASFA